MRRAPPLHQLSQGVSGRGLTSPELSGHVPAGSMGPGPQTTPGASQPHTTLGPLQQGESRSLLVAELSGPRTYQDKLISESQRHQADQHLNEIIEQSPAAHRDHRVARLDHAQHAQHDASATMPEYKEKSNHQAAAERHQRQGEDSTPVYLARMSTAPPQDHQGRRPDRHGHDFNTQHAHWSASTTSDAPTWYSMPQAAAEHHQRQEADSRLVYLAIMNTSSPQDHRGRRPHQEGHEADSQYAQYPARATSDELTWYSLPPTDLKNTELNLRDVRHLYFWTDLVFRALSCSMAPIRAVFGPLAPSTSFWGTIQYYLRYIPDTVGKLKLAEATMLESDKLR
jgi:hypothetical protein